MRRAIVPSILAACVACGGAPSTAADSNGLGDAPPAHGSKDAGTSAADGGSSTEDAPLPTAPDADGDGVPDALDCDPQSATLGQRVVEDDLSTDKSLFAAPTGFPGTSWSYAASAYRQTRLVDASDVSFYVNDTKLGDVQIEVKTASTEISSAITPRLRQIFVLAGASTTGGSLTAYGCGVEVVEGETPEQKTSIVKLVGGTASVVTTALSRVTRPPVDANEMLSIKMHLEGGAMICDVTQGQNPPTVTTATADGLGAITGAVGFFTRQTKALFQNVRVCKVKG